MYHVSKILFITLHISGTIHHMIVIYGTPASNDNISRWIFHFFKILIFGVVRGVKVQKMVQNDKKILSVMLHISGTIHHIIVMYGSHV